MSAAWLLQRLSGCGFGFAVAPWKSVSGDVKQFVQVRTTSQWMPSSGCGRWLAAISHWSSRRRSTIAPSRPMASTAQRAAWTYNSCKLVAQWLSVPSAANQRESVAAKVRRRSIAVATIAVSSIAAVVAADVRLHWTALRVG